VAIVLAGLFGGMIGYSVVDLQCGGECSLGTAAGGFVGAIGAAGGVAIVAVLTLRAMGEWEHIQANGGPKPRGPRRS
jgi:hypothetical protein